MTRQWGPATRRVFPMLVIRISLTSWLFVGTPALGRDGVLTPGSFRHDPNGPDQVVWATAESPAIRFLSLRFAVGAGDAIDKAGVRIYRLDDQGFEGFRDHDATRWARLDSIEFRALTIPLPDDPRVGPEFSRWRGYRIWLDDRDRLIWCGRDSTTTRESRVGRFEELFRREEKTKTISDRVILVPGISFKFNDTREIFNPCYRAIEQTFNNDFNPKTPDGQPDRPTIYELLTSEATRAKVNGTRRS